MSDLTRASAWMALGTIVSRITGFGRSLLLIAALGTGLNADLFSVANTLPNSMYILVAGGVFNVVLVPQLVRAMKFDADRGQAYADRIVTLGLLVLGIGTLVLMAAVPLIMRIVLESYMFTPAFDAQRTSAAWLMVLCMPQVFFYGAFVLIGQILNSRERFGPMMWAPIVNNAIAIAMLVSYMVIFSRGGGGGGFSGAEVVVLGAGSTLGIAAQALVLVPYLRSVGYRFRPRFDFRGVGLGHTLRLGAWTLGFIVVNQIAYFVVVRLAVGASLRGVAEKVPSAGQAVFDLGFLISQLPHGVITVSIATAIIPTLAAHAAAQRLDLLRGELVGATRMAITLVWPVALGFLILGPLAGILVGSFAAGSTSSTAIGTTISAFSLGTLSFTLHYLVLRGFYAMEDTKTPFFIQLVIAIANILLATLLVNSFAPIWASTMLALANGAAYLVGLLVSTTVLSRRVGPLIDGPVLRFGAKLLAGGIAAAVVMSAMVYLWGGPAVGFVTALVVAICATVLGLAAYALVLFTLKVPELREVARLVRR